MLPCDVVIRNATVLTGDGSEPFTADVAIASGRIAAIGPDFGQDLTFAPASEIDATGLALAPGFIDTHTHDDTSVIQTPQMLPKLSQGVTTVIVGNCGISASPVRLKGEPPDPMNLLGGASAFRYPTFRSYVEAIHRAQPAVNVAALVGHTALRSNHMDRLDREATPSEIAAMRAQLQEALDAGALGLSTGLAYLSAISASTQEVTELAKSLAAARASYTTHMRSESEAILPAMDEAFQIGRASGVPVVISHLKCAGLANWGRSAEVLAALDHARATHPIGCDCYPYAAGSSTLDFRQIDPRVPITITWSTPHPELAGTSLQSIADLWSLDIIEATRRLQPAGAIYHSIAEPDVRRILTHRATMIGSDGLPHDRHPHPRLWGTFPRVLGHYCRDEKLFPLATAIQKMTCLPARRFGLHNRGLIRKGYAADLVLFDSATIRDCATYEEPTLPSVGIHSVWVNGTLSYTATGATGLRNGRFLPRNASPRPTSDTLF